MAKGSIRQLRSGNYRARYTPPGKGERGETFPRKTDPERWLATQLADVARGQWVDPALGRITFAEWVETWRAGLLDLRASTLDLNDGVVRNHLLPRFGPMPLAAITNADVRAMVAADVEGEYSASAVKRHLGVLRMILAAAVADGRLGRNVADGVRSPQDDTPEQRFLDPDQLGEVADAVPDHYQALVLTAGWVGLRWGELAGLALDRVDLMRRRITVDRKLSEVNGRLSYGPPKTKAGRRTVSIPAGIADVLAEHFASEACQRSGLAFPTVTGKPMRRNNRNKWWRRAVDGDAARGVPGVFTGMHLAGLKFHELRHTAAALAVEHGAHPLTVKERLGHSSIKVTMDVYGHLFPSQDEALAEALDASFREASVARTWHASGTVTRFRRSTG